MKYHWLVPLISAVLNLLLGVLVLARDRRARLNQVFVLMGVALALWNLNNFVFYAIPDPSRALWWGSILRPGTILVPATVLHLALTLAGTPKSLSRWLLGCSYSVSAGLIVANALGLLVSGARHYAWGLYPVGTRLYGVFIAAAVIQCTLALGVLIHHYHTTTSPRRKLQVRFWLLAAAVLPTGLTNFLPIFGVPIYPLGHFGSALYAAIIAYAIARHRLMDIDVVVSKGVAYAAVACILIGPAFALMVWLQRLAFGHVQPDFSFAVLLMFVAIAVLFPVLRIQAQSRIQQTFFREKSEYRTALGSFARSIVRILEHEKLIREIASTLSYTLHVSRVGVWLRDDMRQTYSVRYQLGENSAQAEFAESDEFVRSLAHSREVVLREELVAGTDVAARTAVSELCRRNGWEVCIPLILGEKLLGFIGLGGKRNLEAFSAEDLDLLETLAAEASVALENARLYEELKKSQDIIRRADRLSALGTLAAGIAHEVRNPLVSIQTFFQLAPQRLHDQEFFTTFLGMTANEVKRISDLITELLSFARSSTPSLAAVNLNELVERVATLLEPEARKHNLTLTRALSANVPLVNADGDQIKQVLINLVLNAIQATRPGGVVAISTRCVDHQNGAFGQIEIQDTGVGIPPDQLEHIFDPFFTTKGKGTGLGLAIAHQIVSEHGGSITVDSREGHGSSFCVNLPPCDAGGRSTPPEAHTEMESRPLRYARARKVASS
ncbi:MAG: ATP-binding protein [Candidatus Binatia bacterium]|jgi:two-component system, NtrC family, sensor kinase